MQYIRQLILSAFSLAYALVCVLVCTCCLMSASFALEVKKSNNNICHDSDSPYYKRVKRYTAYTSLADCLASGGRIPLNKKTKKDPLLRNKNAAPQNRKYSRDEFQHWIRKEGCLNTRHHLLMKQSTGVLEKSDNQCAIRRGRWLDPYTGKVFYEAEALDIDHVVPLRWAWDHGAMRWSEDNRRVFANDETNLLVVQDRVNQAKGNRWPLDWLPPDTTFHCQYVLRFMRIIKKYQLTLSDNEKSLLNELKEKLCQSNKK